jgi:hypothetical protein
MIFKWEKLSGRQHNSIKCYYNLGEFRAVLNHTWSDPAGDKTCSTWKGKRRKEKWVLLVHSLTDNEDGYK